MKCYADTIVGEYVPFYFCPRSVMLYILFKANHPDLSYRGGQGPIVHLVGDLRATVRWADANSRRWAFSDRNAGAAYASFYRTLERLDQINWDAVGSNDFRSPIVKESKQAEVLVHESFPWPLVEKIGVSDDSILAKVRSVLEEADHRPVVGIERAWYF